MTSTLDRVTFTTSRLMEFFSEKELRMQIGHARPLWLLALVKELIDNSLDACESAGIQPKIEISVGDGYVTVSDNGPGLPADTILGSLDYSVRVSDKNHYASPTRGQMGNALKTVWAAPFVAAGDAGRVDVTVNGIMHRIDVTVDHVAGAPKLVHTEHETGIVKNGTSVKIYWPQITCYEDLDYYDDYYNQGVTFGDIAKAYGLFNPHISLTLPTGDEVAPSAPSWRKWIPTGQTSPHWYTVDRLSNLIAGYIAAGHGDKTVRAFVSEFRGLSSSAKQKSVTGASGTNRMSLSDFVTDDRIDSAAIEMLLLEMQLTAAAVKPSALGVIGKDRFEAGLSSLSYVDENTVKYAKRQGNFSMGDGTQIPYVIEVGFGITNVESSQKFYGLNWAPVLRSPLPGIDHYLGENRVDGWDPVVFAFHLASPVLPFVDRGKTRLDLQDCVLDDIESAIKSVTSQWRKIKHKAEKNERARQRDLDDARRAKNSKQMSIRDACYEVMERAYMHASSNNTLPATARQVMYKARPMVLALTGGNWFKNSASFNQGVLIDFVNDFPGLTAGWDVVFDDRGHLIEPHTDKEVGIGTIKVRNYMRQWTNGHIPTVSMPTTQNASVHTVGPHNRFSAVLFTEKEGFNPLFKRVNLAEKYDIAILSTKGQTVTAARALAERFTRAGVPVFVLHDFDKAGIEIVNSFRTGGRRHDYDEDPNIIDIGLSLDDVYEWDLYDDREPVSYTSNKTKSPKINILECGATQDEADFLVSHDVAGRWAGERVELNAFASDKLIEYIESKFDEHGVKKIVPEYEVLTGAYQAAYRAALMEKELQEVYEKYSEAAVEFPADFVHKVRGKLENSTRPWDRVVANMAEEMADRQS